MKFTYQGYRELLDLLRTQGYAFAGYHNSEDRGKCVILRHDIDTSLPQAVRLAELEADFDVKSTYFVLLRTEFYNPASLAGQTAIQRIHALGHEIGLHFDEAFYQDASVSTEERIAREAQALSDLCGFPITTVSMHRPTPATLDADLHIPGLINSYGQTFFHEFKYLSDSRRHWREPVEEIIRSGEYPRLHILTHAFWYHEREESLEETVSRFVRAADAERYAQMAENIRDLAGIMGEFPRSDDTQNGGTP